MGKLVIIRHHAPDTEAQLAALEYLLRLPPSGEDTLVADVPITGVPGATWQRVTESADRSIFSEGGDALREGKEAE